MTASPAPEAVTVWAGDTILIRPIHPSDKALLVEGFAHLSGDSRYRRFLAPVKSLRGGELAYFTEVDHRNHEALVALGPDGRELVGVARFVRDLERAQEAEVAVTVVDAWQGRGIGTALLTRLVRRAREEAITTFTAVCLASNHEVIDLLREIGKEMTLTPAGAGTVEVRIALAVEEAGHAPLRRALRAAADGRLTMPANTDPSPRAATVPDQPYPVGPAVRS